MTYGKNIKDDFWNENQHLEESRERDHEKMKCMDCGKAIIKRMEAPSGSYLPRCPHCNAKRWKQFHESETEQHGKTTSGINKNRFIEGYEDPESFRRSLWDGKD